MRIRNYLFGSALLVAGFAGGVSVEAQGETCSALREGLETNRKQVRTYETYLDIKTNPAPWNAKLARLDQAIAAKYVLSEVNEICAALACQQSSQIDLDNRLRFQLDVRYHLARAIDDVSKTDLGSLREFLEAARRFVSRSEEKLSTRECEKIIQVISATYGENCGAPVGNVTNYLKTACNGKDWCTYVIHYKDMGGDPKYGCAKNYFATWRCGDSGKVRTLFVEPEAGRGSSILLYCN